MMQCGKQKWFLAGSLRPDQTETEKLGIWLTLRRKKAVLLTCSDQGIAAAHRWMGFRSLPSGMRNSGGSMASSPCLARPVLLEDAEALTGDLLETVWKRFYGIPLVIGETARCRIREIGGKDLRQLYEASGGGDP